MIKETKTILCDGCKKDALTAGDDKLPPGWKNELGYYGPIIAHWCSLKCVEDAWKSGLEGKIKEFKKDLGNYKKLAKEDWDKMK